jgi:hypothetical protein
VNDERVMYNAEICFAYQSDRGDGKGNFGPTERGVTILNRRSRDR